MKIEMMLVFAGLALGVIVLVILLGYSIQRLWVRRATKRLFEKQQGKIINSDQTRDRIERINRESKVLPFGANKVIEVTFRNQMVHLVDGTVSCLAASSQRSSATIRR